MLPPLSAQQTLERARSVLASGRGAALPELLKLIESLSLNLAKVTVSELAELIEKDAVVLSRVIAVANTLAHNPGIAPLATVSQAIHQIGYNRIRTIAVSLMLLETADSSACPEQREAAAIALGSGLVAQGLAASRGTHDPELAFACAALRNFGRIIMAALSSPHAREATRRARTLSDAPAHHAVFGLTSVELSRLLLSAGQLPAEVVHTLHDHEPESLHPTASTFDARLIGLADLGGRLATLALDAREGPEDFKRNFADLCRRFSRIVPDATEHATAAFHHANDRLADFARSHGVRALPTPSLRRFRTRLDTLLAADPHAPVSPIAPPPVAPPPALTAEELIAALTPPAPATGWEHDLAESGQFSARPLTPPPNDPWHAALTGARDTLKADLAWAFLPDAHDHTFALSQRAGPAVSPLLKTTATVCAADRNVFGVCLSRLEIVIIHDTRDLAIAPYLPRWWPGLRGAPGAFALLPVRTGAFVRALILIGWAAPRHLALTAEQAAVVDQLARSALGLTPAAAPPLAVTRPPFAA